MKYSIDAVAEYYYLLWHYSSIYDIQGIKRKIRKRDLETWKYGKIDITDYNKIRIIVSTKAPPPIKRTRLADYKEKDILQQVLNLLEEKKYIIETSIKIEGYSKALVRRTIQDKELLEQFNLERLRLNKELKQELNIDIESYPYIIKHHLN